MFDFFRGSGRSDDDNDNNARLSDVSSKTSSLRASAIFPDDSGNANSNSSGIIGAVGLDTMESLRQSIHTISEEEHDPNDGNDNKGGVDDDDYNFLKFSLSSSKNSLFSSLVDNNTNNNSSRNSQRQSINTNLLPQNHGIALQRSMMDELVDANPYNGSDVVNPQSSLQQSIPSAREQVRWAMLDWNAMSSSRSPPQQPQNRTIENQNDIIEATQTEEQWMDQMDAAIAFKASSRHPALQLALHTHLEYVQEQRWKFLRAEEWHVDRAVERLAQFLALKLEAFGSERLGRELRLDDLPIQDIEWWRTTGFLQMLDEKDEHGRPVVFFFGKAQMDVPVETVIRVSMYLVCLSSNETYLQNSGTVLTYWGYGQPFMSNPARAKVILKAWRILPLRITSRHFCYDNERLQPLFSLLTQEWNPFQTIKYRAHFGSAMECIYKLTTLGITRDSIPVRDDGTMLLEYHHSFIDALKVREKAEHLLTTLSEGNGNFDAPFLAQKDREDLFQQMWGEDFVDDDDNEPLPMNASIQNILPEDVLARLTRSSVSTGEPLPIETSMSGLEGIPKSFLSKLAHSSFLRSGPTSLSKPKSNGSAKSTVAPPRETPAPSSPCGISKYILVPGPLDVIMGRGRHNKNKPGNKKLQGKLEEYYDQYEDSDKFQKTALAERILYIMREEGSRFLIRQGEKKHGVWVQVSHEKARDKIAHDFRNMRGTTVKKESEVASREKRRRSSTSSTSTSKPAHKRLFGF